VTLPQEVDCETGETEKEILDEDTIHEAARMLQVMEAAVDERAIAGIVVAEDEYQAKKQRRRERTSSTSTQVFRERIYHDPPERGKTKLHLKPVAVTVTSRTIHLAGERLQALKELEAEWRRDKKIEPGRGPWRAAAFPIKKKSGKWRGICKQDDTCRQLSTATDREHHGRDGGLRDVLNSGSAGCIPSRGVRRVKPVDHMHPVARRAVAVAGGSARHQRGTRPVAAGHRLNVRASGRCSVDVFR
jgi:hypothetical protein